MEAWGEVVAELADLVGGEAVEEEVGDDEVVGGLWRRREGECVRTVCAEASGSGDVRRVGAPREDAEHGGAEVDGVDEDIWIVGEKRRGEAAVSVAEDEGAAAAAERGEEAGAGAMESAAEGEGFEQTVGASEEVEVGRRRKCDGGTGRGRRGVHRVNGSSSRGVSRARSAAARRVLRPKRVRLRSSSRSAAEARAHAAGTQAAVVCDANAKAAAAAIVTAAMGEV